MTAIPSVRRYAAGPVGSQVADLCIGRAGACSHAQGDEALEQGSEKGAVTGDRWPIRVRGDDLLGVLGQSHRAPAADGGPGASEQIRE